MVARLMATQEPLKLTQENHPENAPEPAAKKPTVSLGSMIGICALCGIAGMTLGSGALSTCFMADTSGEVVTMIPLVAMAVALFGGWIGAFFWMCREESCKKESP